MMNKSRRRFVRNISLQKCALYSLATVLFISMLVFPRSFAAYKVYLVAPLLAVIVIAIISGKIKIYSSIPINFYFGFAVINILWVMVGLMRGGTEQALTDALRLYVVWSFIYLLFVIALQNIPYSEWLFKRIMAAGMLISIINFLGLLEASVGVQVFPQFFVEEIMLRVGIHDGYSQLTTHNIGTLLFIIPCLIGYFVERSKGKDRYGFLLHSTLIMCLSTAFISGRRALWLVIILAPLTAAALSTLAGRGKLSLQLRKVLPAYLALGVLTVCVVSYLVLEQRLDFHSLTERILGALTDDDNARAGQFEALMRGFSEHLLLGSGYGGQVSVVRSEVRPWIFELTYAQILFNAGLVGTAMLLAFVSKYFFAALKNLRRSLERSPENVAFLNGLIGFAIGSSTNPYFGSFDFLFVIAFLPLIAGRIVSRKVNLPSPEHIL